MYELFSILFFLLFIAAGFLVYIFFSRGEWLLFLFAVVIAGMCFIAGCKFLVMP